jgi:hypothetical protein
VRPGYRHVQRLEQPQAFGGVVQRDRMLTEPAHVTASRYRVWPGVIRSPVRRANFGQAFVQRPPVGLGRQQAADVGVLTQPQPLVGVVEHSGDPFQVKGGRMSCTQGVSSPANASPRHSRNALPSNRAASASSPA